MKPASGSPTGSKAARRSVGRPPLSYDRLRTGALSATDLASLANRTGWYGDFRQKLLLDLIDPEWCRRSRMNFDVVLRLQPWPFRLRERVHPFHPRPLSHKGLWGAGRLRVASRPGVRRRLNVHRRQMENSRL